MTTKLFGKRAESGIQPVSSERASGTETTKLVHIVEMKGEEATARHDVKITRGTRVSDVKASLKYGPADSLIRAKGRQILSNDCELWGILDQDEKLHLIPDTKVGA